METEGNTFWKVARELDLENKMKAKNKNFAIQGELIGEGIQGNPYKIKGHTVRFFTAFDIDAHKRFNYAEFAMFMARISWRLHHSYQLGQEQIYQKQLMSY